MDSPTVARASSLFSESREELLEAENADLVRENTDLERENIALRRENKELQDKILPNIVLKGLQRLFG